MLPASGGTIADIRVEGAQRIEPLTIRSYLTLKPGDPFDSARLDESLKALFATGLFADATFHRDGDVLVVSVVENPIINRIAFEGNKHIDTDKLEEEVQLRARVVYTRTKVQHDVERILEIYRRSGRFAATVEPKIIQLDENRVDLVFEINEGATTSVRSITFIGNDTFSESELHTVIQTRESRWWRFLSTDDTYDPDRMTYDRELLRRFYLQKGYADFRVVSGVAELTEDRANFFITYTVDEGQRYKFGKIQILSHVKGLDVTRLQGVATTVEGTWYNAEQVEQSINKLNIAVGDQQYAFVDVKPLIQRNRDALTIDLTYEINEGQRVYVERIDIIGNARSLDKVVRREMQLVEGDPFNASKVKRSEQRLKDLGFFEKVEVKPTEGSQPDRSVLQVKLSEKSTGSISLGAGYSTTEGPLADFGIRESNLLGRGQDLRFNATVSAIQQNYDISYTEPYFLDRDLAAGVDLFRTIENNQDYSSYEERITGTTFRLGYPISDHLRQRLNYTLESTSITNVDTSIASIFIQDQAGTRIESLVGSELFYDMRDSKLDPTDGYYIRLNNDVAGLGGAAKFVRNKLGTGLYFPLADGYVLNISDEAGAVTGIAGAPVNIVDRFFLGGDTLRGFAPAGIGPRALSGGSNDALGGNLFYRGTVQLSFPSGLPEEFGVLGHVFTDLGSLSQIDDKAQPGETFVDSNALRLAVGAGISWKSPLGPITLDLAAPVLKQSYDRNQIFHFSFGTRF